MVIVIVIVMVVAFVFAVPGMFVAHPAMLAFPVTLVPLATLMVGYDPVRAGVRRPRPIAFMPAVMSVYGIPVAFHPHIIRPGCGRTNLQNSGWRRRTDRDTYRDLSKRRGRGK